MRYLESGKRYGSKYNWNNLKIDYYNLGSLQKVADKIGCSIGAVHHHFKKQKIIKFPKLANRGCFKKNQVPWNNGKKADYPAWNKGIPCSEETKEKLRIANIGRKHSAKTIKKMKSYTCAKRYNWKGGKRGNYSGWQKNRNLALERDNYTCQVCGTKKDTRDRQLSVHHINPLSAFFIPKEAHNLDNLETVCSSCHSKLHIHQRGKFFCWVTKSKKEAYNRLIKEGHIIKGDLKCAI